MKMTDAQLRAELETRRDAIPDEFFEPKRVFDFFHGRNGEKHAEWYIELDDSYIEYGEQVSWRSLKELVYSFPFRNEAGEWWIAGKGLIRQNGRVCVRARKAKTTGAAVKAVNRWLWNHNPDTQIEREQGLRYGHWK